MNAKNTNLHKAKKEANDEFYTQYDDIAKEIEHYKEHLKGKVVYCNCDIPYFSNFHKYFLDNFKELQLKKLIATGYVKNGNGKCSIYDGEKSTDYDLLGDGDFRGDECVDMLQKADVIITNPPFSLFREFIKVVVDNRKDFIVVGNKNATTYKDVFPMFMSNTVFIGATIPNDFITPLGETKKINGLSRWFTSFNVRNNEYLHLTKEYFSLGYPKYDNYNAINVDKVKDIPKDYDSVMGVPITLLDKYNPNQFEIIGCSYDYGRPISWDKNIDMSVSVNGENIYKRLLIKRKGAV